MLVPDPFETLSRLQQALDTFQESDWLESSPSGTGSGTVGRSPVRAWTSVHAARSVPAGVGWLPSSMWSGTAGSSASASSHAVPTRARNPPEYSASRPYALMSGSPASREAERPARSPLPDPAEPRAAPFFIA